MPKGGPKIGRGFARSSAAEDLLNPPQATVLGTIAETTLNPPPKVTAWTSGADATTQIEVDDPPPPWEVDPHGQYDNTNARRFVDVPESWELRWINRKTLDQFGWRYWQPVMASDPRVKVKIKEMVSPTNNISKGHEGDILAFMPRSWVEARKRQKAEYVARVTSRAVTRQEDVQRRVNRGEFGPYLRVDEAHHPTHTIGDGRTMRD